MANNGWILRLTFDCEACGKPVVCLHDGEDRWQDGAVKVEGSCFCGACAEKPLAWVSHV